MDLECFVRGCDGKRKVMFDGTTTCNKCPSTNIQWAQPRDDEPVDNATEFQGYIDDIAEVAHGEFIEWYAEYVELLDVYYAGERGWPNEEMHDRFLDLQFMAPVMMLKFLDEQEERMRHEIKKSEEQLEKKVSRIKGTSDL